MAMATVTSMVMATATVKSTPMAKEMAKYLEYIL
jgi:hypothetical protein